VVVEKSSTIHFFSAAACFKAASKLFAHEIWAAETTGARQKVNHEMKNRHLRGNILFLRLHPIPLTVFQAAVDFQNRMPRV
jgi:hypothetical protein